MAELHSRVFFDLNVDDQFLGRITIDLFGETPKTSENFRALCTGEKGKTSSGEDFKEDLSFKACPFHRIIPGFMAQGGDFTK